MRAASHRRTALAALAVLVVVTGCSESSGPALRTGAASASAPPADADYRDAGAPVEARVADLLGRMTLEEKVGQVIQIQLGRLAPGCESAGMPGVRVDPTCLRRVLGDAAIGSILSGGGEGPAGNDARAWAEMTNEIQRYAVEETRLGIPILYGLDLVHGPSAFHGATIFPHQIGLAAAWDPALVEEVAALTGAAARATGVHWVFSPVADLGRDARWGRYYETFGEDPVLAGELTAAVTRGLQGDDGGAGRVAASAKHFVGYSQPLTGHDRTGAELPVRYLQDTLIPPFQAAVDAGAHTVMVNSASVNGVPVHMSPYLLRTQLRERMGFDGVVISDWQDVRLLQTEHQAVGSYRAAMAAAFSAGIDMVMEPSDVAGSTEALRAAVESGDLPQERLDDAVRRVLTLKFRLGLFEDPYVDEAAAAAAVDGVGRDLARRAVQSSSVLLRNDGVLPLRDGARILVTGPNADSPANQMGNWTIYWRGLSRGDEVPAVTVVDGLRAAAGRHGATVVAADGDEAVAAAADADVAVVVVGEGITDGAEGLNDAEVVELAADQQRLVADLQATGTPVVVVVVASRPLVLGAAGETAGLLMAWQPGTEAGNGIADLLFGDANPSGRLPVSWPRTPGDVPMFYQQRRGPNYGPSSDYDPAHPFGAGLSYTTFAVRDASVAAPEVAADGTIELRVTVANTGDRDGAHVVPVFVTHPVTGLAMPERLLAGFTRVDVAAGEEAEATVTIPVGRFAVTPGDVDGAGEPTVPTGPYTLEVGGRSVGVTVR